MVSFQRHKPIDTDMINDLPDNVLIHILSFLSTKNAIKTSMLSTKWRYLWTYLPVFDLRIFYYFDENRNPSYSLLDTVATLVHRYNHRLLEIKRLTISIPRVTLDAHKITSLVTSLLSLKVQDLQFSIDDLKYMNTSCMLPGGFSASCSLSKLTLKLGGYTLYIPNGIQFPSLKTLDLSYATFANDESVEEFFAGCPLLEDLTLNNCYWLYIKQITISISTLRILNIRFDPHCLNCVDCDKFLVKIDAVNLLYLTCTSDPTIQFIIVNPPISMLDAYIAFTVHFPFHNRAYREYEKYVSHCASLLLSGLASVKSLTLSKDTFVELSPYVKDRFHLLLEFHNLTNLCLDSEICSFSRTFFTKFLLKCPKLEVLVFPLGITRFKQNDNQGWKLIPVPCCIKSSLKKLHITNFQGYVCEIKFAEFFLENATVLEEFQITLSHSPLTKYNSKNLADLKNQFVGMGNCDIKFRSPEHVIRMRRLCKKCYDFK